METIQVKRKFKLKIGNVDKTFPDPDPKLTPEEVKELYSLQFPELLNANISNQKIENDELIVEFSSKFGGKG